MFNFIEIYSKLTKNTKIIIQISEIDEVNIKIDFICDIE